MSKKVAGLTCGGAALLNGAEQATNTNNTKFERIMGAATVGLSVVGGISSVASAESRMCGLLSCFTAGTQVVVGEEIIESEYRTEFIQAQSFDECNVVFAGLGIGGTILFATALQSERKR
ncbi:MAG: hypothetical protein LBU65_04135, partial [Planctomycetaceae bacterium]|nr:hypothetical protein [Planctomycetaceae bacterium]